MLSETYPHRSDKFVEFDGAGFVSVQQVERVEQVVVSNSHLQFAQSVLELSKVNTLIAVVVQPSEHTVKQSEHIVDQLDHTVEQSENIV